MSTQAFVDGVEVAWRPGCPFCMKLRTQIRLRGIETTEFDIWSDPSAAERVRQVTGGDETVPTVFVGTEAMVNPSIKQVVAAMERQLPDRTDLTRKRGLLERIRGKN